MLIAHEEQAELLIVGSGGSRNAGALDLRRARKGKQRMDIVSIERPIATRFGRDVRGARSELTRSRSHRAFEASHGAHAL